MKRVFLDTNILFDFALGRELADNAEKKIRAKAADCDIVITNNGKDCADFSNLPFATAAEFLKEWTDS